MAIVNRHYRWRGIQRLLVTLALDAGYLLLLWNLTMQGIGEWRLLVLLPIAFSVPFVLVNCVEIIYGGEAWPGRGESLCSAELAGDLSERDVLIAEPGAGGNSRCAKHYESHR
jgi:hypothetical protein